MPNRGTVGAVAVFLGCALLLIGCQEEKREYVDIWIINASETYLDGVYVARDPRIDDWGENLLVEPIPPDGIRVISQCLHVDDTVWIWPHSKGEGLVAHGVLTIQGDAHLLLSTTDKGDFKSSVDSPARAVVSARFMIPGGGGTE